MKTHSKTTIILLVLIKFLSLEIYAYSGPFDGNSFKGRIAYSADGNYNDEDDWAASAVALAIFAEFGVKDKLVHFDFNCILPRTNKDWEKEHEISIDGAIENYAYPESVFHNCQKDLDGAVNSIMEAVNASSIDNPLYFILAGPMEVPYKGIQKSDPNKRKYVYCISHNVWNDGYASADLVDHNKRDVIPEGVNWIQIRDQNEYLSTSPFGRVALSSEWDPWRWMQQSNDPNVKFLWDRLYATRRADCSDAGMSYFLMTGDEEPEISKLKSLIEFHEVPDPMNPRFTVRMEAENFFELENFKVDYRNDKLVSQRISIVSTDSKTGSIRTRFDEPYTVDDALYDADIRYFDDKKGQSQFQLVISGQQIGKPWSASDDDNSWKTHTIENVKINNGDEIKVIAYVDSIEALHLDYIQLAYQEPDKLDDPNALPGQIIVAGSDPGYLKYNGAGPAFLSGPDNPEDFLFRGTLNKDGTRTGGGQEEMIKRLAQAGVNAFHCQMFRMKVCNIKDEGDDDHGPFIDHKPSKGLDQDVLDQWDGWLDMFEKHGINVHLEFYNDATDVEMMGWVLNEKGNLHPEEQYFIEGVVNKFKHHKNILWGIEESCNKLPRNRTPHFKKIGELIAETDNFNHPIIQSFVIPEDPEGDFPGGGGTSDDYIGDPNIRLVTWLHVVSHGEDFEAQHQQYLHYYNLDARNFIVLKNETFHHPKEGPQSRRYMWACAMAGVQTLEAYHDAAKSSIEILSEDGFINKFIEKTEFHKMQPRDDLATRSTKWVLAKPGDCYIAYTYDYLDKIGVENMTAGTYDLLWLDTVTGEMVIQNDIPIKWGNGSFDKPEYFGKEVAVYIKKRQF